MMIPEGVTLYTWVDVDEVLLRAQDAGTWPPGLIEAGAYWDELLLRIKPGEEPTVRAWLAEQFAPRFKADGAIVELEGVDPESPRALSCRFEVVEGEEQPLRNRPTFGRPRRIRTEGVQNELVEALPPASPPVVAFHSFKGGVGRTTHAIGFAMRAAKRSGGQVLLIDGDFEAPGITWHVRNSGRVTVAYADFLALVHSDPDPSAGTALELTARRLESQRFGELIVMPAFRSQGQWSTLEVPPALLQERNPSNPFLLTELLAQLGARLGVAAVVVDLRAGISELSAGLMLDPRVARVVVTTLSSQSICGTEELLARLGRQSTLQNGSAERNAQSGLVINSIPDNLMRSAELENIRTELLEKGADYFAIGGDSSSNDFIADPPLVECAFDPRLLTLPAKWDVAVASIEKSGIPETLSDMVAQLLPSKEAPGEPSQQPATLTVLRKKLADFAQQAEYAESGNATDFLRIRALVELAFAHRSVLPLVVMTGAKGAGKTYTFLQMLRCKRWDEFVRQTKPEIRRSGQLEIKLGEANAASFVVGMAPANLEEGPLGWLSASERTTNELLRFGEPIALLRARELARQRLRQPDAAAGSWLSWWLDLIAWRCGYEVETTDAWERFARALADKGASVIILFDGLEDLFQDIHSDRNQQEALRALIQDVPEWLRQAGAGRVGAVLFVRGDLLRAAVRQNAGQLEAKYSPYQLRWNEEEALRLAAWLAVASGAKPNLLKERLQDASTEELIVALEEVWGARLGAGNTKEAITHRWVLAVLADFRGQIQARDMVRLIAIAAKSSVASQTSYPDRLLIPSGMKAALEPCGRKKVDELEQETPPLKDVFKKIREMPEEERLAPFSEDALNLTSEETELLKGQGLAIRDAEVWYFPELIRLGLDVKQSARGRPRILALRRRLGLSG